MRGPERDQSLLDGGYPESNLIQGVIDEWDDLSPEKKVYYVQLGVLVAVQIADGLSTYAVAKTVPFTEETNSVSRHIMDNFGILGLVATKTIVGTAQAGGMLALKRKYRDEDPERKIGNILRVTNPAFTVPSVINTLLLFGKSIF